MSSDAMHGISEFPENIQGALCMFVYQAWILLNK